MVGNQILFSDLLISLLSGEAADHSKMTSNDMTFIKNFMRATTPPVEDDVIKNNDAADDVILKHDTGMMTQDDDDVQECCFKDSLEDVSDAGECREQVSYTCIYLIPINHETATT